MANTRIIPVNEDGKLLGRPYPAGYTVDSDGNIYTNGGVLVANCPGATGYVTVNHGVSEQWHAETVDEITDEETGERTSVPKGTGDLPNGYSRNPNTGDLDSTTNTRGYYVSAATENLRTTPGNSSDVKLPEQASPKAQEAKSK